MHNRGTANSMQGEGGWYMIGLADEGLASADSFFWSKPDLQAAVDVDRLRGIDVWLEHGDHTKECLATVLYAWVDADDGLYVLIKFDDSPRSRALRQWVGSGLYKGLSLGYNTTYDQNYRVLHKNIFEISLVHKPYHEKCQVKAVFDSADFSKFIAERSQPHSLPEPADRALWSSVFDPMTRL